MFGLPFREMWALDFEYISESGANPDPVCLVARELTTNQLQRWWYDELPAAPPFPVDDQTLFVAYYAPAEIGCFLELGWPVPARVLDLYTEFRNQTNGLAVPEGRGLLGALSWYHIAAISKDVKHGMRERILAGGPFSPEDRAAILEYCQSDVDVLGPLLERMAPAIAPRQIDLNQALQRGRYMIAVARMERTGVPLDTRTLNRLRQHWDTIKTDLIAAVDKDYGVYEGMRFKSGLFAAWLAREGIAWPRSDTGQLRLDRDTFHDLAARYPQVQPLKELRHALSGMRLERLAVGPDGRNRTMLSPFGASSSRNTPSNNRFIFGPAVWLRGLIRPCPGHALAYIDWSSQEVAIAATLSGDSALTDAVDSGDPYLSFARMAGLAPPEATKASHPTVRAVCKTCLLGSNYGMQAASLAYRAGVSTIEAQSILRALARTFPIYTAWAEHQIDRAMLRGYAFTVLGWLIHVTGSARPTSLQNFQMQANGAEMLRLACCLATERGIAVCAPVHDALLIEAPTTEIDQAVQTTREAMAEASRFVLNSRAIDTDVEIITDGQRYHDPRGEAMWNRVTELLHTDDPDDQHDSHDHDDVDA